MTVTETAPKGSSGPLVTREDAMNFMVRTSAGPLTGTLHSLADRRAGSVPEARLCGEDPRTAPDPEEVTQWKLFAERAGHVLGALEAAAAGRRRPGAAALAAEVAGLRAALEGMLERRLAVTAIVKAARTESLGGAE